MQAVRQFGQLLSTAKSEIDSFEGDVEAFEALGSSSAVLAQITSTSSRLDVLESGIGAILDVEKVSPFFLLYIIINLTSPPDFYISLDQNNA